MHAGVPPNSTGRGHRRSARPFLESPVSCESNGTHQQPVICIILFFKWLADVNRVLSICRIILQTRLRSVHYWQVHVTPPILLLETDRVHQSNQRVHIPVLNCSQNFDTFRPRDFEHTLVKRVKLFNSITPLFLTSHHFSQPPLIWIPTSHRTVQTPVQTLIHPLPNPIRRF